MSEKNLTLLCANLTFVAISAMLYLYPAWAIVFYPMYAVIFYWTDYMLDQEMHVIFIFMAVASAFVMIGRAEQPALRAAIALEMGGVVGVSLGLGFHRSRLSKTRHKSLASAQDLDARIRDLQRDINYFNSFESSANAQIQLRRDLTEAAKSLGTTMDPEEVQRRLARILAKRYPKSKVTISPGQPPGPLVAWSVSTRTSVLVKDIKTDERFAATSGHDFRSAVVSPLVVMRRPFGFLQLQDGRPAAFRNEDLRTVDLFATLASLTLENIQLFENVNDQATHDALTHLYTHKAFQNRLQEEILRGGRAQQPVSLIMCDVDHFKKYNDTYGHQAGDDLLRTVAKLLRGFARPVDFVARYGGEEFALILPGLVRAQTAEFANRVRIRVSQEPFVFQGATTRVTMSFGVSSFPQDATTHSQLVRAADERLYKAKTGGRNRVVA